MNAIHVGAFSHILGAFSLEIAPYITHIIFFLIFVPILVCIELVYEIRRLRQDNLSMALTIQKLNLLRIGCPLNISDLELGYTYKVLDAFYTPDMRKCIITLKFDDARTEQLQYAIALDMDGNQVINGIHPRNGDVFIVEQAKTVEQEYKKVLRLLNERNEEDVPTEEILLGDQPVLNLDFRGIDKGIHTPPNSQS